MPKVPVQLQAEPKVCAHTGNLGQAQGSIRRDTSFLPNNLIEARKRDAEPDGECGL